NTAFVQAIEELWFKGNLAVVDQLYAADFVEHDPVPGQAPGIEGLKQYIAMLSAAFPDGSRTIDDGMAAGDKVAHRWPSIRTHEGPFMGIPPTDKQVSATGTTVYRLEEGKIVESWTAANMVGMLQQLGVISSPESAREANA